ncbi:MAG TPA: DEAD/DEAH box helicase [bacterium]|nr:DEAD/DEAH box helicase [bacterium]
MINEADIKCHVGNNSIFERGRHYYINKKVISFNHNESNDSIEAVVSGNDDYAVKIRGASSILHSTCSCPYYRTFLTCKHIAAVLIYYLKNVCYKTCPVVKREFLRDAVLSENPVNKETTNFFLLDNIKKLVVPKKKNINDSGKTYKLQFILKQRNSSYDWKIFPMLRQFKTDGTFYSTAISYDENKNIFPLTKPEETLLHLLIERNPENISFDFSFSKLHECNLDLWFYNSKKKYVLLKLKKILKTKIDFNLHNPQTESRLLWEPVLTITESSGEIFPKTVFNQNNIFYTEYDLFLINESSSLLFYKFNDNYFSKIIKTVCSTKFSGGDIVFLENALKKINYSGVSINATQKKVLHKYPVPKPIVRFIERYNSVSFELEFDYGFAFNKESKNSHNEIPYKIIEPAEEAGVIEILHKSANYENSITGYLENIFLEYGAVKDWHNDFEFKKKKTWDVLKLLGKKLIDDGFEILVNNQKIKTNDAGKVSLFVSSNIDWFDIEALYSDENGKTKKLYIDKELLKNHFILIDGDVIILNKNNYEKLNELVEAGLNQDGKINVSKYHFPLINKLFEEFELNENKEILEAKSLADRFKEFDKIKKIGIPKTFNGTLRNYQTAGVNWINFLFEYGVNGCLADDMGLGKTVQALAFLQFLKTKKKLGVILIVAPVSTLPNWENEIIKFTSGFKIIIHHGTDRIQENETFKNADIILVSYHTLRNDIALFLKCEFNYIILDEAQNIKNVNSLIFKTVRMLKSKHKLTLTGTPIENNTLELWAQFDFLLPGLLGSQTRFKNTFSKPIETLKDKSSAEKLKNIIFPFILRRKKEDVLKDLPEKNEIILFSTMSKEQKEIYNKHRDIYRANVLKKIDEQGLNKSAIHIFTALLKLRQLSLYPGILDAAYNNIESCKLEQLKETVSEILSEKHKILIFSQFVRILDVIKNKLAIPQNIPYSYIDGQTPAKIRKTEIDKFQNSDETKLFLLSLKTGAFGINLTAADYVVIFDPWWNPAVESQAIDRAHRIGQTQKVIAYKMLVKDTVEEKILELQNKKKNLIKEIISSESAFYKSLTKNDIEKLFG